MTLRVQRDGWLRKRCVGLTRAPVVTAAWLTYLSARLKNLACLAGSDVSPPIQPNSTGMRI